MNTSWAKLRVIYTGGMPAVNTACKDFPVQTPRSSCWFPGLHVEVGDDITGLLGYIHNGTADTMALTLFQDAERRKYFEFSRSVFYSNKKIFVNIPQDNWDQYFAFFQSYQLTTWIGIAVALLVQCVLCVVINRIEAQIRKRESKESALELVWQMLRLQLLQSKTMRNSSKAGKFSVVVFSLIQCTVIMGVLSSYIFSNLVRPKAHIPFKTFDQFTSLISDGTLHMVEITKHNVFYEAILDSNASDYTAMREALEKNPLRLGSSLKQVMAMMDEPGAVLLRSEDERISFELSRKCNIYSADTIFPPAYGYFVFKKGFPFVDRINKIIEKEHWRLRSLWRKYLEVYRGQIDCAPASTQVIGPKYPYFGTVMILLLVELVAIAIFFGEVIARYVKRLHWKQGRVSSATL